jgi:(p)ppGpp synthase/HD superfamily hydrolase
MSTLSKAISIAAQAFENIMDKGGKPYILHPLWVMNQVRHLGDKYMIVAVLHDLIEDTPWTIEDLRREGFSEEILDALKLLDFRNVDYFEQIKKVALVELAREIKIKDIEHNSRVTRLKGLTKRDFDRTEKYHRSYTYLIKT